VSNMSGDTKAKTASTRATNMEMERRKRNSMIINWCIILLFGFGFAYMLDVNDHVIKGISYGCAILWNGVGSFLDWQEANVAAIAQTIRTSLLFVYVGIAGVGWFSNKQNL